jgi:uncharacterized protein (TIGR02231 family)
MTIRTILFVLAFVAILPGGPATAATLTTSQAGIDRVVVYQDRAQVDRTASVGVGAGRTEITLTGLPAPLIAGSVRAYVDDDRGEVIGLTQREEVHLDERRAEVRELLGQIRDLRADLRGHQVADAALAARLEQIGQMRAYTRSVAAAQQTSPQANVNSLDASLDLFADESRRVLAKRSEHQLAMVDLSEREVELQQRVDDLQYGNERTTTTVTVTVDAAAATTVPLVLSYGVSGVRWQPRYDLRYDDDQLTLAYLAEVRQSSGEDWTDVKLVFTTARPDEMVPPPANQPLYLSGYKEKETTVQLGSLREEVEEEWDDDGRADEGPPAGGDGVQVVKRSLAVDLELTRATSVPADGRPYRITIMDKILEAEVDRYAAPSLSPHLYLRAQTSNQTGVQLLAGTADVFRSAGYVGTLRLPALAPGEKLDLSLGPAGPVTVTRDFDAQRNREVVTTPGRKKVHFVYDLVVNNYGDEAIEVVVSEAVPTSRVDQVKVELAEETTPGFVTDEGGSVHTWTLTLAPGEEQRVHLAYVIDLPDDYAWEGF